MEFIVGLVLISSISPLLLLIMLIVLLLVVVLILVLILENYLFSYLVFLLFISGLIMMLMYFCSIVLNEKYLAMADLYMLVGLYLSFDEGCFNYFSLVMDFMAKVKLIYFEFYNLLKYSFVPYSIYSLFFIGYLFITLIVVYEVVNRCGGPLRMKI